MGNTGSNENAISEEALDEYVELTYLSKGEIRQIYKLLDNLEPGVLKQNPHYRFPAEQINKILPHPFLSFEDTLDLCSAFSANCPRGVRASWAFEIFDFDGDNQVSLDDLIETVRRLAGTDERGQARIDRQRAEDIARMVGVHSCCAFSTKDGIGKRLILLPKAKRPLSITTDFRWPLLIPRQKILQEMDLSDPGNIAPQEFMYMLSKMPDFAHMFQFKIN